MKRNKLMVWRWPVVIGVVTLVGLVSALVGDGTWDWISAIMLAIPTLLCAVFSFRKQHASASPSIPRKPIQTN